MIIEERINNSLYGLIDDWTPLEDWEWPGEPYSQRNFQYISIPVDGVEDYKDVLKHVDKIIKEADASECLTSNIEYVRECKKWYMENK